MKYLSLVFVLILVLIYGCAYPILKDSGKMRVISVESWSTEDGSCYKYLIQTNIRNNNNRISRFYTYSRHFYPTGTEIALHFGDGWIRKPPNIDL